MSRPGRQRAGFTLMEMMVVLLLVALAVGLMFDALGLYRVANQRVAERTAIVRTQRLVRDWMGDSIRGLRVDEDRPFAGSRLGFSGYSLQPLKGAIGGGAPVSWRIEGSAAGAVLAYEQDIDGGLLRLPLPMDLVAFAYFDESGERHADWPPRLGEQKPLPALVALVFAGPAGEVLSPVAVRGPLVPLVLPFETEVD